MKYTFNERSITLIKDPYIGMPITLGGDFDKPQGECCQLSDKPVTFDRTFLEDLPLAMAYVSFQQWRSIYPQDEALERGTLFQELDLPFRGGMER